MNWRLLYAKELASHLPLHTDVVAAIAEVDDEGLVFSDTLIALDSNGTIDMPPTRMPLNDLFVLLDLLLGAANKKARDEGNQAADPR